MVRRRRVFNCMEVELTFGLWILVERKSDKELGL